MKFLGGWVLGKAEPFLTKQASELHLFFSTIKSPVKPWLNRGFRMMNVIRLRSLSLHLRGEATVFIAGAVIGLVVANNQFIAKDKQDRAGYEDGREGSHHNADGHDEGEVA